MLAVKNWIPVILLGFTLQAQADNSPPPSGSNGFNIARLEQIQSETLILEAQAQRTKAEMAAQGSGPVDNSNVPAAASANSALPRVMQISGAGSALSARLLMSDGSQAEVIAGQTLSGAGMKIARITAHGVEARQQDGTVIILPMAE